MSAEVDAAVRGALRAERARLAAMVRAASQERYVYAYQDQGCIGVVGTREPTMAEFAEGLAAALERDGDV